MRLPPRAGGAIAGCSAEVFVPYDLLKPLSNVPPKRGTFHQPDKFGILPFDWVRPGQGAVMG
jgi:hypothetical protein